MPIHKGRTAIRVEISDDARVLVEENYNEFVRFIEKEANNNKREIKRLAKERSENREGLGLRELFDGNNIITEGIISEERKT